MTSERLKVSEYCDAYQVGEWRVRNAISKGFLETDPKARVATIIGGEMPLSVQDWRREIEPALSGFSRGCFGFEGGGVEDPH
jgi:hypothetical protein